MKLNVEKKKKDEKVRNELFLFVSSGPKNKRRKNNDRRLTSRDRRADYYEDSGSPHHEHVPTQREARYNDMAPK